MLRVGLPLAWLGSPAFGLRSWRVILSRGESLPVAGMLGVNVFRTDSDGYEAGQEPPEKGVGGEKPEQKWWFDRGRVAEDA